jgi:radical SAM enzyme (TIGR01210 family)
MEWASDGISKSIDRFTSKSVSVIGREESNVSVKSAVQSGQTLTLDTSMNIVDRLRNLHYGIRQFARGFPNPSKVGFTKLYKEWMHGKTVNRLVIFSPVIFGCEYRLNTGGCSICGEALGIGRRPSLLQAIKPIIDLISRWSLKPEWVCWYIEGNILNPNEFPTQALEICLRLFAEQGVRRVTIESRPEYITDNILDSLEKIGKSCNLEIEIGIGLETSDDFIRDLCIFKGFTLNDFKGAVRRIMQHENLRVLAYVLLKPPFIEEAEAILDAERSINQAFKLGVHAVSLELTSIQQFTILEYLYLKEYYRPPWLWSAIEVLQNVYKLGEVRVGGEPETYFPQSARAAYNCEKCTTRVWESLRKYNETHSLSYLKELSCDCKEKWFKKVNNGIELENMKNNIIKRITSLANDLCLEEYLKLKLDSYYKGEVL